jgi:hypothetical protein
VFNSSDGVASNDRLRMNTEMENMRKEVVVDNLRYCLGIPRRPRNASFGIAGLKAVIRTRDFRNASHEIASQCLMTRIRITVVAATTGPRATCTQRKCVPGPGRWPAVTLHQTNEMERFKYLAWCVCVCKNATSHFSTADLIENTHYKSRNGLHTLANLYRC